MEIIREPDFENATLPDRLGDVQVKKRHGIGTTPDSSKSTAPPKMAILSTKARILPYVDTSGDFMTSRSHSPLYGTSQRSSSGDSHKSGKGSNNVQTVRQTHSEASKLRSLNNGNGPVTRTARTQSAPYAENFSRPRKVSVKAKEDLVGQSPQSSTSPYFNPQELGGSSDSTHVRDRGLSLGSSKFANMSRITPLRPHTAISEPAFDLPMSRNRQVTGSSAYSSSSDLQILPKRHREYQEPLPRSDGMDEEAVRASLRSAVTASSSFFCNSGTERSSFMTKSSPATSIYGRDEGMSVEDAIGMYEAGFDDEPNSRPGSFQSCRGGQEVSPVLGSDPLPPRSESLSVKSEFVLVNGESFPVRSESLGLPLFSNLIIRDSTAMFGGQTFSEPLSNLAPHPDSDSIPSTLQHQVNFQTPTSGKNSSPSISNEIQKLIPPDDTRDRYGFRKQSPHVSVAEYDAWNGEYTKHLERRRMKWVALMKNTGFPSDSPVSFPQKSTKIKRFIRKGIPPDWRGAAWFWYAGGPAIVAKHYGVYERLVQQAAEGGVDATDEELIERDLHRTFPDNIKFKPNPVQPIQLEEPEPETPILKSLRRVLRAFSIYNPKIGYCQSLNFLAGLLLLFMEEEKAFWLLNIITTEYLPGTHEVNLEGANVDLGVLMTSIKESMPAIWAKIANELDGTVAPGAEGKMPMRLPPITLCCTAWFMSCFIGTLPIESTLRVWDSFFYEGSKTFFRISLAIFKVGEAEIRAVNDPMEVFQVVQTIPRRMVDANALMEACFKRRNGFGHLSQETIEVRRSERRAAYAEERDKTAGKGTAQSGFGRKNTLFGRRKGKRPEDDAEIAPLKTSPSFPL